MKYKNKIISIFMFIIISTSALGVQFYPEIFYVDLNNQSTEELRVTNDTNKPLRYRVSFVETEIEGTDTIEEEWVRFYPKVISVSPHSTGIVRMRISPPKGIEEKEFIGELFLEEVESRRDGSKEVVDDGDIKVNMAIKYNFTLTIYGQKGERKIDADMINFDISRETDGKYLNLEYLNKGNATLRANATIKYLDKDNKEILEEVDEEYLGLVYIGEQKKINRELRIFEETQKIEVSIYHFDFATKENTNLIYQDTIEIEDKEI